MGRLAPCSATSACSEKCENNWQPTTPMTMYVSIVLANSAQSANDFNMYQLILPPCPFVFCSLQLPTSFCQHTFLDRQRTKSFDPLVGWAQKRESLTFVPSARFGNETRPSYSYCGTPLYSAKPHLEGTDLSTHPNASIGAGDDNQRQSSLQTKTSI